VVAPATLRSETRALFRKQALEVLDQLKAEGEGLPLVIDLSHTISVDSSGLGSLVFVHTVAAESRRPVRLRGASEDLRFLLVMTGLEDRFILESGV